jgi:hypothetical protein
VDLLEHEVLEAALLDGLQVPGHLVHLPAHRAPLQVEGPVGRAVQHPHVAVVEIHDVPGHAHHRRHVGARHEFTVGADPQQERAAVPGHHDLVGVPARDHGDAVGALHLLQGRRHRVLHGGALGPEVVDEVHHHLGVGLGAERISQLHQLPLQDPGVLDDAVVDQGDVAGGAGVGVGVGLGGRPVGGPPGVGDPHVPPGHLDGDRLLQFGELARPAHGLEDAVVAHDRDPRRVVPPVLEAPESLQENGGRLPVAQVAYDAAHGRFL